MHQIKDLILWSPNIFKGGSEYPGIYKRAELELSRRTSRRELACLMSWKLALNKAKEIKRVVAGYY